ncbi:MAG: 2Fe-2S iron-sulfur cluster-binding protein [Verrucomicrobiae bacterium]|nr:2Fe-2S iron-sulfur cluster-binding protein [Verrucomicrobiae bacterium]
MITLTIDGKTATVPEGSTILDAARTIGVNIPTLCFLAGVKENKPSCMTCVVRIGSERRLMPACSTQAVDGMVVFSDSPDVKAARRAALELLLSDHLGDCISVCQRVCPARMKIPEVIRLVAAGRMKDAIARVKEDVVFPGVLGRICRAPCEMGCRRRQYDGSVAIQLIEREVAEQDRRASERFVPVCAPSTGKRVAVVGAGATGLSAAFFLLRCGHRGTVLDAAAEPGGQMRNSEVPQEVLEADIDTIRAIGMEFHGNTRLGETVTLEALRSEFDAVVLGVGPMSKTNHTTLGVDATERTIRVRAGDFQTNIAGVFAGGSCIRSGWDPARSVGDGHWLAKSVDAFLAGRAFAIPVKEFTTTIPKLTPEEYRQLGRGANSELSVRELITEAERAAGRCCHCDCRAAENCRLRRYAIEYGADPKAFAGERRRAFEILRQPGGVIFEPGKCISCGICVAIAEQAREPLGLTFIGRGFDVKVGVPLDGALADALQKVGAECVKHCPTGALAFELDDALRPAD